MLLVTCHAYAQYRLFVSWHCHAAMLTPVGDTGSNIQQLGTMYLKFESPYCHFGMGFEAAIIAAGGDSVITSTGTKDELGDVAPHA